MTESFSRQKLSQAPQVGGGILCADLPSICYVTPADTSTNNLTSIINGTTTHTHVSHTLCCVPFVASDQRFSSQVSLIPPWEDQCEWRRMTRMTGPDCAVIMCNLINTHTHTHTQCWTNYTTCLSK